MSTLKVIEEEGYEYKGDITLCGGGGGPSGSVSFPDYMEKIHVQWLTGGTVTDPDPALARDMEASMQLLFTQFGGNPYENEGAYSSSGDAGIMQAEHTRVQVLMDAINGPERTADADPSINDFWELYMDISKDVVEDNVVNETEITNAITAFRDKQDPNRRLAIASFSGGMADMNAVHSSQYILGLALIETEFEKGVDSFSSDIRIRLKESKQQLILHGVQQLIAMLEVKVRAQLEIANMQFHVSEQTIITKSEEINRDLEINVKESLWDVSIHQHGGNLLASINGSANPITNQPSTVQSMLGGAARGAAAGGQFGLPGAAIGAGVGALIGAFT